jgi:YggT family protein
MLLIFLLVLESFIYAYSLMIIVRVAMSWFPDAQNRRWVRVLAGLTDPFLDRIRMLVPPIGGRIDLSPIIALFSLQLVEGLLGWMLSGGVR